MIGSMIDGNHGCGQVSDLAPLLAHIAALFENRCGTRGEPTCDRHRAGTA